MLKNCCCCCDVKVGSTLVGTLWFIFMILEIIVSVGVVTFSASGSDSHNDDNTVYVIGMVIVAVDLLIKGNMVFASIGLLFGVKLTNFPLMLWWLVSAVIVIIADTLGMISTMVRVGYENSATRSVVAVLVGIAAVVIYLYVHSYLCVLSHYKNERMTSISVSYVTDNGKDKNTKLKYAPDDGTQPPPYSGLYNETDMAAGSV